MTEPEPPPLPGPPRKRILFLLGGMALVFITVAAVLLKLMPAPHKELDYLVAGSLATVASLGVGFLVLVTTWMKAPDVFFKRRRKTE